jgi:hypothetical protein
LANLFAVILSVAKNLGSNIIGKLSACAEDHGLSPWMNAQNVAESFTYQNIDAPADFAIGE